MALTTIAQSKTERLEIGSLIHERAFDDLKAPA